MASISCFFASFAGHGGKLIVWRSGREDPAAAIDFDFSLCYTKKKEKGDYDVSK
jgi:hypothetical protein